MNEEIAKEILLDEGYKQHKYIDTLGVETIGIGFNLEEGFSKYECMLILESRINGSMSMLSKQLPYFYDLPEPAMKVLVNMCYQMGWPRLSLFKKFLSALSKNDFKTASVEMLDSKWAKQTPNRANKLAKIIANIK